MGKYNLTVKFGKNFFLEAPKGLNTCAKKRILFEKPTIIHGINPTLIYSPSGQTITLPRFCTKEMQQARQLNKIAIRQAKSEKVVKTYPKATPQDLKRLTSVTLEDSYSRVEWTNPKDGKIYNLLKEGETKDGKVVVKILDEEGAFIKVAQLTPKNIVIPDDYTYAYQGFIPHGILVSTYAKRMNPFANYKLINMKGKGGYTKEEILKTYDKLKQMDIDYLSISKSENLSFSGLKSYDELKTIVDLLYLLDPKHVNSRNEIKILNKMSNNGTRILLSAGNDGFDTINVELLSKAEGVGSITNNGKITYFSGSRNSGFTQHYELGIFRPRKIYDGEKLIGYNITETNGCDISIEELNRLFKIKEDENKILKSKIDTIRKIWIPIQEKIKGLTKYCGIDKFLFKNLHKTSERARNLINGIYANFSKHVTEERLSMDDYMSELIEGTSFSTPIRAAKLALNDMMEGIL